MRVRLLLVLFLGLTLTSCQGVTRAGTGDDGDSDDDSSDFLISGTLSSLSVSGLGLTKNTTSGTVTDVMAVSPEAGGVSCESASVNSDGSFDVRLGTRRPWFFYFFDRTRRGSQMFLGRFRSDTLDTIVPVTTSGSADLGTITISGSTGIATSTLAHDSLVEDLGLDSAAADVVGGLDDVARRYSNPDVDDDGEVDCGQTARNFQLDFHVRFNMLINSQRADMDDVIGSFFDETKTTTDYTGTGVYVSYPTTFSSQDTGSVIFTDSQVTTDEGGTIPAGTATSMVTTNNFGSFNGFGPNTTSATELPSGEIIFSVGGETLTFSDVETPPLSALTAPTGRIFPFIRFNKTTSSCTSNCTLSGISYKWMKKTASSWTEATLAEIDYLVAGDGGTISIRVDDDAAKTVTMTIPKSAVSGTVDWDASNATLSGVTSSEFEALVTTQICHLGLSYDDQLGMRYFEGIDDASGTCS